MHNQELAKIFYDIANFLEMEKMPFKPQAYQKAALALESLDRDAEEIYKEEGKPALLKIPGVGESLADKIVEYLKTGKIKYYESLKKKTPVQIRELISVEGLGPKRVRQLYQKLEIRNLKDLERAAKSHKIAPLFGFGEKTEKNILQGIEFVKRSKGRFLLGQIIPRAREVCEKLKNLKGVERVDMAGSLRRMKETIGDVDFLVISKNPGPIMDFFVSLPGVEKIWGKGTTKTSVRLKEGFDMDLRVVPERSYGSALQYFTGSVDHNIVLRKIAMDFGLKLSEYGLFRGPKMIAGKNEEEIYRALGLDWVPPELRENQGEVEAAQSHRLPQLVDLNDIRGDLHCHSDWDGGSNSIKELVASAQAMGYDYLGISDHTKFLRIEKGLDEKRLELRNKEIDKINSKLSPSFRVLKGCEANILNDGAIDIKDEALAKLDYVIAGIHSSFKMSREKMTERMIRALRNPHVDIVSHPTGRLIKKRDEYQIDLERVMKVAAESGKVLEVNSYPERLDLNDQNIKRAKELGVKLVINTDSHHKDQMRFMEFGVAQARRGWAEKKDIANCWSLEKLLKYFRRE